MSARLQAFCVPEQYLKMDRKANQQSECVTGRILKLAGATREHNRIMINIGTPSSIISVANRPNRSPSACASKAAPTGDDVASWEGEQ